MAYPCPQCNDQSTQRISLLYDSSTRGWTDSRGRPWSSRSNRASEYSPPQPRAYGWRALAVLFLSLFGSVVARGLGQQMRMPLLGLALAWIVLGASAHWLIGGAKSYNAKVWQPAMREWESLCICRRCGHTFVPQYGRDIHSDRVHA
jgi:Zn-dependent protease